MVGKHAEFLQEQNALQRNLLGSLRKESYLRSACSVKQFFRKLGGAKLPESPISWRMEERWRWPSGLPVMPIVGRPNFTTDVGRGFYSTTWSGFDTDFKIVPESTASIGETKLCQPIETKSLRILRPGKFMRIVRFVGVSPPYPDFTEVTEKERKKRNSFYKKMIQ
jgi:hypothetical protein